MAGGLPRGEVQFYGDDPPEIDVKADAFVADACRTDVHVSSIRAEAFGAVALVYGATEEKVEISAQVHPMEGGRCGPRPWPYSGPNGIVMFDQAGRPQGAP